MIPHRCTALFALLTFACTLPAAAQQPRLNAELANLHPLAVAEEPQSSELENKRRDEMMALLDTSSKLVKGKPYSADSQTVFAQNLTDGNRILRHTSSKFYRDANGRTRNEQTFAALDPSAAFPTEVKVFIDDPVTNVAFVLEPNLKTARKLPRSRKFLDELTASSNTMPETKLPELDEARDIVTEDIGHKTISGVDCNGSRTTITIPAGQVGNERAIVIVTETWFSPAIAAVVQSSTTDPRFGQTTYTLANVQVHDQPLQLFELPPDYRLDKPLH